MTHRPILTVADICRLISADSWMMDILKVVNTLQLPDWWVCAGFVRSKVWDELHNFAERIALPDVDVIYFDPNNIEEAVEKHLEVKLSELRPTVPWSVKNQARMHQKNGHEPYISSSDAMSKFPETATAIGVRLQSNGSLLLSAPWGIVDLVNLIVRPTPMYMDGDPVKMRVYENRINQKGWNNTWPLLQIHHFEC